MLTQWIRRLVTHTVVAFLASASAFAQTPEPALANVNSPVAVTFVPSFPRTSRRR